MVLLLPLILVMAGVLQIAAAYLNIGSFISYISRSVIIGYISAAAVLIIANQVRNIAGITIPEEGTLLGVIESTIARLHLADWPTVLVAAATAAVFLTLKNLAPRLPNVGLTLVASVGIGFVAQQLGYPVAMLPEIVAGNWRPTMPILDFGAVNQLASAALAIAFLGMLEGASIGKSLAAHAGERLNTNQETFALVRRRWAAGRPRRSTPTTDRQPPSGCRDPDRRRPGPGWPRNPPGSSRRSASAVS
jgi:SulP family sulfate permease